jgi:DNA-binding FadR family transcriptional regulator
MSEEAGDEVRGSGLRAALGRGSAERPKLHVTIARDIREQVQEAGWPVGEVLGSEAVLADQYGVSRSIMREAARLLEHLGVATMTRGPSGGLTTREPAVDAVVQAFAVVFDFSGVSLGELLQVKAILERWAARAAAERVTPEGLDLLDAIASRESAPLGELFLGERQGALHNAISQQSGNPIAVMLLAAVTALVARYGPRAARRDDSPSETLAVIEHAHSMIVEAIRAGDADLAERRMSKHVSAQAEWWLSSQGERALWTDRDVDKATSNAGAAPAKLAEIVAERIRDDIIAAGWVVGATLGTEPTLLERYSVSRSVFREAVRLLEHHSVVEYRPGNNGGLVVGQPRAEALVDAASSYLGFHRMKGSDIAEMRLLLERKAAELVATRSPTETSALARHLTDRDGEHRSPCLSGFHLALSQLCGNRALALMIELLLRVQATRPDSAGSSFYSDPLADHGLILEAVLAGRSEDAGALMRAHLSLGA